jgi:hypothetical protein
MVVPKGSYNVQIEINIKLEFVIGAQEAQFHSQPVTVNVS